MKNVLGNARYWVTGTLTATVGVLLARVVAPHAAAGLRVPAALGGEILAIGGLLVICFGVSRRVNRKESADV
ncbi:hypothetical protein [Opitutus sp. ER46]|uniref:hypothetical protein n=1 Tax=Opitutus sp. ER46 TaxID=2161864 RepID=UPI000D2F616A|nr:hypothetical protein [Opitutus sp. ER46]PTX99057.1 hypothetical protein DB354_03310 [Opitutus sp. ER46]